MRYVSVDEGRRADGLRLVLSKGLPGPWGVAAKAIVDIKRLDYLALAQEVGAENAELRAWTGQVSAPVLAWNDEPPCTDSLEILFLAERLAPSPRLIPEDVAERVRMFGIAREIIGRQGLGWERRVMLLAPIVRAGQADAGAQAMASRYGCVEASAERASGEVVRIVSFLARELRAQLARGSRYFVGDALSAADLYWAAFSLMLQPLPTPNARCRSTCATRIPRRIRRLQPRCDRNCSHTAISCSANISGCRWIFGPRRIEIRPTVCASDVGRHSCRRECRIEIRPAVCASDVGRH
ncbi:MAG TPA: glutathione binding-like protein, partial [Pseudomonadales bacterium]|nr:glutathione binding-like protein [Pseudomonadales bacterium]